VRAVLDGRSVLAVLPTSAGKSLCYQLPAVLLPGVTVVVSPLIALMKDQVDALTARGIEAVALNSQLTGREAHEALEAIRRGSIRLVYVAPERLLNRDLLASLAGVEVSLVAVDEAHCLSQWGHDFRPDYRLVPVFRRRVGMPPILALTATAPLAVRTEIARELGTDTEIVAPLDRPNLRYGVPAVATEREQAATLAGWLEAGREGSVIVYAPTRKATEAWAARLGGASRGVLAYHAGMETTVRQASQDAFMSGQARAIVATTAFGMGVDKPDIRAVIHVGLPESVEAYVQEVGRAGRDGQTAWAVTLSLVGRDAVLRRRLLDSQRPDRQWLERRLLAAVGAAPGSTLDLGVGEGVGPSQGAIVLPHLLERGIVAEPDQRAQTSALRLVRPPSDDDVEAIVAAIVRRHEMKMRRFAALVAFLRGDGCRRDALAAYFSAPQVTERPDVCCDRCSPEAFAVARPAAALARPRTRAGGGAGGGAQAPAIEPPLAPPAADGAVVAALDCCVVGDGSDGDRAVRLVIWKGDGTVLVHGAHGREPSHTCRTGAWHWDAAGRVMTWGEGVERLAVRVYGVRWRQAWGAAASTPSAQAAATDRRTDDAPPQIGDGGLREALRQWRATVARERGVPAYVICWDRHLDAIALDRPGTLAELARIPGLPRPTREAHGQAILDMVARAGGQA